MAIKIKKKNIGKFTNWAKAHNMGVQEAASHIMSNTDEYSPTLIKRANFARNANKWKKSYGGAIGSGAASGALAGASFGPWGAAVGAGIGGIAGALGEAASQRKIREQEQYALEQERLSKERIDKASLANYNQEGFDVRSFYACGGKLKRAMGGRLANGGEIPTELLKQRDDMAPVVQQEGEIPPELLKQNMDLAPRVENGQDVVSPIEEQVQQQPISFKDAFRQARQQLGKGKTFTWNGKLYTTNYAEEEQEVKEAVSNIPQSTRMSTETTQGVPDLLSRPKEEIKGVIPEPNPYKLNYNYQGVNTVLRPLDKKDNNNSDGIKREFVDKDNIQWEVKDGVYSRNVGIKEARAGVNNQIKNRISKYSEGNIPIRERSTSNALDKAFDYIKNKIDNIDVESPIGKLKSIITQANNILDLPRDAYNALETYAIREGIIEDPNMISSTSKMSNLDSVPILNEGIITKKATKPSLSGVVRGEKLKYSPIAQKEINSKISTDPTNKDRWNIDMSKNSLLVKYNPRNEKKANRKDIREGIMVSDFLYDQDFTDNTIHPHAKNDLNKLRESIKKGNPIQPFVTIREKTRGDDNTYAVRIVPANEVTDEQFENNEVYREGYSKLSDIKMKDGKVYFYPGFKNAGFLTPNLRIPGITGGSGKYVSLEKLTNYGQFQGGTVTLISDDGSIKVRVSGSIKDIIEKAQEIKKSTGGKEVHMLAKDQGSMAVKPFGKNGITKDQLDNYVKGIDPQTGASEILVGMANKLFSQGGSLSRKARINPNNKEVIDKDAYLVKDIFGLQGTHEEGFNIPVKTENGKFLLEPGEVVTRTKKYKQPEEYYALSKRIPNTENSFADMYMEMDTEQKVNEGLALESINSQVKNKYLKTADMLKKRKRMLPFVQDKMNGESDGIRIAQNGTNMSSAKKLSSKEYKELQKTPYRKAIKNKSMISPKEKYDWIYDYNGEFGYYPNNMTEFEAYDTEGNKNIYHDTNTESLFINGTPIVDEMGDINSTKDYIKYRYNTPSSKEINLFNKELKDEAYKFINDPINQEGTRKHSIAKTQKILRDKGLYEGSIDGKWGKLSSEAWNKFKNLPIEERYKSKGGQLNKVAQLGTNMSNPLKGVANTISNMSPYTNIDYLNNVNTSNKKQFVLTPNQPDPMMALNSNINRSLTGLSPYTNPDYLNNMVYSEEEYQRNLNKNMQSIPSKQVGEISGTSSKQGISKLQAKPINKDGMSIDYSADSDITIEDTPTTTTTNTNTNIGATPSKFSKYAQVAEAAYPFIDNIFNLYATSKTPKVPKPILNKAVQLKTDYDINPQLNQIGADVSTQSDWLNKNISNPQVAASMRMGLINRGASARNPLYSQKYNIENQLANQNAMNAQQVEAGNIAALNQYNMMDAQRTAGMYQDISRNLKDVQQDVDYGLTRRDTKEYQQKQLDLYGKMYKQTFEELDANQLKDYFGIENAEQYREFMKKRKYADRFVNDRSKEIYGK